MHDRGGKKIILFCFYRLPILSAGEYSSGFIEAAFLILNFIFSSSVQSKIKL
jgi:hypothetical protein